MPADALVAGVDGVDRDRAARRLQRVPGGDAHVAAGAGLGAANGVPRLQDDVAAGQFRAFADENLDGAAAARADRPVRARPPRLDVQEAAVPRARRAGEEVDLAAGRRRVAGVGRVQLEVAARRRERVPRGDVDAAAGRVGHLGRSGRALGRARAGADEDVARGARVALADRDVDVAAPAFFRLAALEPHQSRVPVGRGARPELERPAHARLPRIRRPHRDRP